MAYPLSTSIQIDTVVPLHMHWHCAHNTQSKEKRFYLEETYEILKHNFPFCLYFISVSTNFLQVFPWVHELTQEFLILSPSPWPTRAHFLGKIQHLHWFTIICAINKTSVFSTNGSALCLTSSHVQRMSVINLVEKQSKTPHKPTSTLFFLSDHKVSPVLGNLLGLLCAFYFCFAVIWLVCSLFLFFCFFFWLLFFFILFFLLPSMRKRNYFL